MIYPAPYKRNDIFYFKYTDKHGIRKQKSCSTNRKGKAQQFIREFFDKQENGPVGLVTLSELLVTWRTGDTNPRYDRYKIEGKQYGKAQVKNIQYALNHIEKHKIMKIMVVDITKGNVLDLRDWLISQLPDKPQTINKIFSALRSIFTEYIFRDELRYNPFALVGKVDYTPKEKEILNPEQVLKLLDNFTDPLAKSFCSLLALSGMRQGEAMALSWNQIEGNIITINRAFKSDSAKDIGLPKWNKTRTIILSKHIHLPEKSIGLVFRVNSHRVYFKWWYEQFYDALKSAELPRITPHSLRHVVNSELLRNNISPYLIQKYLGWSSGSSMITKVQEGYTHINSKDLQIVADAIDSIYTVKNMKTNYK
ncbi:MAG: site-specific integrase [Bacteroidales bacterium]|nr:site-specific integrase [Bacteroidales bacterium]